MRQQSEMPARIKPEWAGQAWRSHNNIWTYNRANGEEIGRFVTLPLLGGLVVAVSTEVYSPVEVTQIAMARSLINLAFDDDARLTSTSRLLEAAEQIGNRPQLVSELQARQIATDEHGPDEAWALPLWGLDERVQITSA